jgi:hypothetical protein
MHTVDLTRLPELRRRQLFEIHEMPWCPDLYREASVEVLNLANKWSGFARALAPAFAEALGESRTVLDLCSGAGGPVTLMLGELEALGRQLPLVMLSDLFPNVDSWQRLCERWPGNLDFVSHPVDATAIPAELEGDMVTVVNALHHFPPEIVGRLIAEVAGRGSTLFVAEAFPRSVLRASAYIPWLLAAAAANPFIAAERRLGKALISFGVPLIPIGGGWDWLASTIRIHQPEELVELGRAAAPHYTWSHGETPFPPWGRATFVVGRPGSR